jgi:hypothetical protein
MIRTRPKVAVLVGLALLLAPVVAAKKKEQRPAVDEFTGTLVTMDGTTAKGPGDRVTIWIEEYTTDDVTQSLMKTLADGGQTALGDALKNQRAGTLRVGTSTSYTLSVARQRIDFEDRVVQLVTSGPLRGFPLNPGVRPQDYPFGFIEVRLRPDGTGQGTVVGMVKLAFDREKNLRSASYGTQSASLTNVETVRKK